MAYGEGDKGKDSWNSPFRNIVQSTRQALTSRLNPTSALQIAQAQRVASSWLGNLDPGLRANLEYGPTVADTQLPPSPMDRLAQAGQNVYAQTTDPLVQAQIAATDAFDRMNMVSGGGERTPTTTTTTTDSGDDIWQLLENQIAAIAAQYDQALANGEAEVAAAYNEKIGLLRAQQAKLATGRDKINVEYEGLQSELATQRLGIAEVPMETTGTDIDKEAADIANIYDQGDESLNDLLKRIGADSPILANQLGQDMAEFSDLAEEALRNDLSSQAKVLRAGQIFAQKAADAAVAETAVGADEARTKIELQINGQIQSIADAVQNLEDEKAAALQAVRDKIGEYDSSWVNDPDTVWESYLAEYMKGKDLTFEEEAELRNAFENQWFSMPTDQRTRSGMAAWARQNMRDLNFALLADALGTSVNDFANWLLDFKKGQGVDPDTYDYEADINRLLQAMQNPQAIESLLSQFGLGELLPDIDWVSIDDYSDFLDMASLREDFVNEYEGFRDSVQAGLAGAGVSPSAIDGSKLTRTDMQRVSSPSGAVGYLLPPAASGLQAMVEAAAKEEGIQLSWSDTYRSYNDQMKYWMHFTETYNTNPNYPNMGQNAAGNWVPNIANPNSSLHPKGLAIDFTLSPGVHDWLKDNAGRFGFTGISSEAWHWQFTGDVGQYVTGTPASGEQSAPNYVSTAPPSTSSGNRPKAL